ncbi:hypothetical protein B296_00014348 [Ensete ventricosum]|uniref:Uncharacterized protein n=1 Tax=Ensete ventricosum TaxID=4639 RepID=A0A426ZDH2_ENSVE|nr:hypothetical protein B296_00014348 [Ensete ventricosum]
MPCNYQTESGCSRTAMEIGKSLQSKDPEEKRVREIDAHQGVDGLRARRELAKGDRELVGSAPGVRRKIIERLAGSSPEDAGKFAGSLEDRLTCRTIITIVIVS